MVHKYLQFTPVLPHIVKADDIWVLNQLHDDYLSLNPKGNGSLPSPLYHCIHDSQTCASQHLCRLFAHNLDCCILLCESMSCLPYSARGALANGLAQLPWSNVCFAPELARSIGGVGDLRVAIGIAGILARDGRDTLVFCLGMGRDRRTRVVPNLKITPGS